MALLNVYLNGFVIKRRLIRKCSCVPSTQNHLGVSTICISSLDSDIAIYELYFALQISILMCIETGASDWWRCIDIQNVINEIREEVCLALPALHPFTGNDYTSVFYGICQVKALKILIQSEHHVKIFKVIGHQFTLNA